LAKHKLGPGTPDCPVVHLIVSGAPGWLGVNWALSEKVKGDVAINHRTVRWCTGLSGEPTAPVGNGRPRDQHATRGRAKVGWVHRTVSGAPTDLEDQQSTASDMKGDRAPDRYSGCPVVHRPVRCTTR
jgi:hypothetical protein